ncbi:uncharacterized protein [Ptychodera flava]|uniref:uncharacterized protein n=1 Tax=Ptychodera flava TaxID=63121 RepID=UPI003969DE85
MYTTSPSVLAGMNTDIQSQEKMHSQNCDEDLTSFYEIISPREQKNQFSDDRYSGLATEGAEEGSYSTESELPSEESEVMCTDEGSHYYNRNRNTGLLLQTPATHDCNVDRFSRQNEVYGGMAQFACCKGDEYCEDCGHSEIDKSKNADSLISTVYKYETSFPSGHHNNVSGFTVDNNEIFRHHGENSHTEKMEPEELRGVFDRLDSVIRRRVNIEVENLRRNIQDLITDQQLQYRGGLGLSAVQHQVIPPLTQDIEECAVDFSNLPGNQCQESTYRNAEDCKWETMTLEDSTASSLFSEQSDCYHENDERYRGCTDEELKMTYMVELMTSASIITMALQRQEYAT